jgi:hypothetical protein
MPECFVTILVELTHVTTVLLDKVKRFLCHCCQLLVCVLSLLLEVYVWYVSVTYAIADKCYTVVLSAGACMRVYAGYAVITQQHV